MVKNPERKNWRSKTLKYFQRGNRAKGYYLQDCTMVRTVGKRKLKLVKYFPDTKQVLIEEDGTSRHVHKDDPLLEKFDFSPADSTETWNGKVTAETVNAKKSGLLSGIRNIFGKRDS